MAAIYLTLIASVFCVTLASANPEALVEISAASTAKPSRVSKVLDCKDLTTTCVCGDVLTSDSMEGNCNNLLDSYHPNVNFIYEPDALLSIACITPDRGFDVDDVSFDVEPEYAVRAREYQPLRLLPANFHFDAAATMQLRFCNISDNATVDIVVDMLAATAPRNVVLKHVSFAGGELRFDTTRVSQQLAGVQDLNLESGDLEYMPYDLLRATTHLRKIYVNYNAIRRLDEAFPTSLIELEAGGNKITEVAGHVFRGLTKLRQLHLWHNGIAVIAPHTFDDLGELQSLELMRNALHEVDPELFVYLRALRQINLGFNHFRRLPPALLGNNSELVSIRLEYNGLLEVPKGFFSANRKLVKILLNNNNLTELDENTFAGLVDLEELTLANNRLQGQLPSELFRSLRKLKKLYLNNNALTALGNDSLAALRSLEVLHLDHNRLQRLYYIAFTELTELTTLNVAHNELVVWDGSLSFVNPLISLKVLDVSYNRLDTIPDDFLLSKLYMEELIMTGNQVTELDFRTLYNALSCSITIDLAFNNITHLAFIETVERDSQYTDTKCQVPGQYITLNIANNSLACDADNYALYRYVTDEIDPVFHRKYQITPADITCASPPDFVGLEFAALPPAAVFHEYEHCPAECMCIYQPAYNRVTIDCSERNLTSVPLLFAPYDYQPNDTASLKSSMHVVLRNNHLRTLDAHSFDGLNVSVLDVGRNQLTEVNWLPLGLQTMRLDHNQLRRIDRALLAGLTNTTLDHNPWICDCETVPFWIYLAGNDSAVLNPVDVRCAITHKSIRLLTRDNLCPMSTIQLIAIVALASIVPAIATIVFYRYKLEIKVWLYAHNMCLWCVREADLDRDKQYDAFVSFSQKDEQFVLDELLPRLEAGPRPYKLCIHMRNWIPGEFIAKQVADSVLNSRRTIVVLSPAFLESVWGKMEFRAAHTKALAEGVARVIVVLYDDLDPNDARIDDELRVYLKTNTYVRWGDTWFWDKLLYALPHREAPSAATPPVANGGYVNKRFESISVNLDKMNQNAVLSEANTNGGVPADGPLLIKQPALDFDVVTPPAEKGIV